MSLHPKIKEAMAKATPMNRRAMAISASGKLISNFQEDLDKRIINGYLATWGTVNDYGEKVIKGAFTKSIQERGPNSSGNYKLLFLWMHDTDDPLAAFAELVEDDYGLRFKTLPLDDVPNGDRCIKQIRSGTLNQFSYGFDYIWDKVEWDSTDDSLVLKEVELWEGSVVSIGADTNTFALRSSQSMDDAWIEFNEEMHEFIKSIPRKHQQELRHLITRHKSLAQFEPSEQRRKTLEQKEPAGDEKINYIKLLTDQKVF
jgi:HK97 family phage prohead protease